MKKGFKSKKASKINIGKSLIILIIIISSFVLTFKCLTKIFLKNISKEEYVKYITSNSFGNGKSKFKVNSISSLLKSSFGINKINTKEVISEINKNNQEEIIEQPTKKEPLVYIYNSHQGEEYKSNYLETFNIKNNVLIASFILKEYLSVLEIDAYVEENSVADILHTNGWKYNASYKASRILMENAKKNIPSLEYFIDLHRDSSPYNVTTTNIDNENYARILFVIGLENPSYEKNLVFATKLNEEINKKYPTLSRGIIKKQGKRVNGVYNQDFSPNTILIELGGQYNTIEEVNNTLKILSKEIASYINGVK